MTRPRPVTAAAWMLLIAITSGCATPAPVVLPMECPALPRPPAELLEPPNPTSYLKLYERLRTID